jgi:hypothetical protein
MAKFIRVTTPVGIAAYPRLTTPDTKFDADGVYSIDLDLDPKDKEVTTFLASLKKASDVAYEQICKDRGGKKLKRASFPTKETEDGMIRIKFKLKAKAGNADKSWSQKPMLFDASGKAIAEALNVGSGTKCKVSFEVIPYFTAMVGAGVSLRLKAVQILELKEYTPGDNFDAYGFKSEDGFVAAAKDLTAEATTDFTSGDDF